MNFYQGVNQGQVHGLNQNNNQQIRERLSKSALLRREDLHRQMLKASSSGGQKADKLSLSDQYVEYTYRFEIELTFQTSKQSLMEELGYPGMENGKDPRETEVQDLDEIVPEYVNSTNTAARISDFSTSLLPHYLESHGETLNDETITGFMELIGGAIDTGFEQARAIITDDWQVMNDPLSNLINKTYNKVQENLAEFEEQMRGKIEEDQETIETDQ
ncbi:MAG: DUF5610 domain-containing protein [bacterium]